MYNIYVRCNYKQTLRFKNKARNKNINLMFLSSNWLKTIYNKTLVFKIVIEIS